MGQSPSENKTISLTVLHQSYQNHQKQESPHHGEVILDVRTPKEWAEGHIPGSLNIPHEEVGDHVEELKKYNKVYIHCQMGGRAQRAFATLISKGLSNLHCLSDAGMEAWKAAGYPIEK